MLKVAICDDDIYIREFVEEVVGREICAKTDLYESGEELIASGVDYDILFLDICLSTSKEEPHIMDGMETARKIREYSKGLIIFITAVREYVFEAYDVEAFHYLTKPIDEKKLCEVLKRAAAKAKERNTSSVLLIKANGKYLKIPKEDIYYVENDGRKVILHTVNGTYSYYEKMETLEEELGEGFFRSHRGYLVNLKEVAGYDRTSITLKSKESVFLAKLKYNDFVAAYMDYLMK